MFVCINSRCKTHSKYAAKMEDSEMLPFRELFPSFQNCEKISKYSISNVFYANEFVLFYKLPPDYSRRLSKLAGRKNEKERLASMACI